MNFLDLHNRVLSRLREERIDATQINSNPYYRSIAAHINDAKQEVENAWQWSQLRQVDEITVSAGGASAILPDSIDNNYVIQRILVKEKGRWLRWASDDRLAMWNANSNQVAIRQDTPAYYAIGYPVPESAPNNNAGITGLQTITLFPPANQTYTLEVTSWHNQDDLEEATDILKVPSLPVYSLATALASRERGEVGGAPTSALFEKAQQHLSDAIAYDSARFPEELDWTGGQIVHNTNHGVG